MKKIVYRNLIFSIAAIFLLFVFHTVDSFSGNAAYTKPERRPNFNYKSTDFDIPVEINYTVWEHVESLQRRQRHVRTVLERGAYYIPAMQDILFEVGCPRDMVYLAMIESNFSPTARSVKDAAGMWQFMPSTGKIYDLKITDWVDERLDIIKSSRAAGIHLLDLYDRFGNWSLVLAAYNAGPGKVNKAIKKNGSDNFWEIAGTNLLKTETKNFVPKFYGALLVGKYPDRFGITDLKKPEAFEYKNIKVPPLTDINVVAKLSGVDYEQLANLNAQYLYECTPPFPGLWRIRVPKKFAGGLEEKIKALDMDDRNAFLRHKVRRGESLSRVSSRYRVNPRVVLQANGLKSWRGVRPGKYLLIPVRKTGPAPVVTREPEVFKVNGKYKITYAVGKGDTLWKIAKAADVSLENLLEWNKISPRDLIHPGQNLIIFCESRSTALKMYRMGEKNRKESLFATPPSPRVIYHTVRPGESLSRIARRHNVTVKELVNWNKITDPNKLRAGQRIKIYQ